jgi:hypothetical protein
LQIGVAQEPQHRRPEAFSEKIKSDIAKFARLVKASRIKEK